MHSSQSIVNLAKALLQFQSKLNNIGKDAVNPFHKNKYATLTNILDGINQQLIESSLVVIQNPGNEADLITLTTLIMHAESGEFMESTFKMMPAKKDPQAIGSCITYMRRYALASILKLNVDEDDDGNAASKIENVNEKIGLTPRGREATKKETAHSASFIEIKGKIELSQSVDELNELGVLIQQKITSNDELNAIRAIFKDKKKSLT